MSFSQPSNGPYQGTLVVHIHHTVVWGGHTKLAIGQKKNNHHDSLLRSTLLRAASKNVATTEEGKLLNAPPGVPGLGVAAQACTLTVLESKLSEIQDLVFDVSRMSFLHDFVADIGLDDFEVHE